MSDTVEIKQRLCLTEDGKRVVPEDDPEARWLWAIPGQRVSRKEAERLGALEHASKANEDDVEDDGEPQGEDNDESFEPPNRRRGRPAGSKNRTPDENK
ncbi:hypothetical protein [Streptomyces sp. NPDC015131]|uniref:hypothetical protein n=1 Tax=Streptomyces sp. NPDC015131 TaxID=3364941 RepID=UPI0036FBE29D